VERKREIYLLSLELVTIRREKDASEERLAEIYKDLQNLVQPESNNDSKTPEEALLKYQEAISVYENQVQMVQTSCGEVLKTMKEEIISIMEEKGRVELDLLNKLSSLNTEKKEVEANLLQRVVEKDMTIELLQKRGMDGHSLYSGDVEELENEISTLLLEKKNLEDALTEEQKQYDVEIQHLERSNAMLEQKVQALAIDVAVLRSGNDESKNIKDTIERREEELGLFIDRIAQIRDQTNSSVENLKSVINKAKANCTAEDDDDSERILSMLEAISLVHDQLKVSLHMIELQLQNRLKALRNEKFGIKSTAAKDNLIDTKLKEIKRDTLEATSKLEDKLSESIGRFEIKTVESAEQMKAVIQKRAETLEKLQSDNQELKQEIIKLKLSLEEGFCDDEKTSETDAVSVSKHIIDQLQFEILKVVDSVKVKNEAIKTLSAQLYHQRLREKEMRLQLRRVSAYPESPEKATTAGKNHKTKIMQIKPISKSPSHLVDEGKVDESGTRTVQIAPIRPSRREIFSPQFTQRKDLSI
jgi:hypothetical protein